MEELLPINNVEGSILQNYTEEFHPINSVEDLILCRSLAQENIISYANSTRIIYCKKDTWIFIIGTKIYFGVLQTNEQLILC